MCMAVWPRQCMEMLIFLFAHKNDYDNNDWLAHRNCNRGRKICYIHVSRLVASLYKTNRKNSNSDSPCRRRRRKREREEGGGDKCRTNKIKNKFHIFGFRCDYHKHFHKCIHIHFKSSSWVAQVVIAAAADTSENKCDTERHLKNIRHIHTQLIYIQNGTSVARVNELTKYIETTNSIPFESTRYMKLIVLDSILVTSLEIHMCVILIGRVLCGWLNCTKHKSKLIN